MQIALRPNLICSGRHKPNHALIQEPNGFFEGVLNNQKQRLCWSRSELQNRFQPTQQAAATSFEPIEETYFSQAQREACEKLIA